MLMNLLATGLAVADVSQGNKWREEDIIQRKLENTRRDIDERQEQLRSIANLAALIAGFDVVIFIELNIPEGTPEGLLIALGITSALTVSALTLSFMLNTLILIGILKAFDITTHLKQIKSPRKTQSFREFWSLRCEEDFRMSFMLFTFGVPMFMVNLGVGVWVKFLHFKTTCSLITAIIAVSLLMWYRMHRKWGHFLVERDEEFDDSGVELKNEAGNPDTKRQLDLENGSLQPVSATTNTSNNVNVV